MFCMNCGKQIEEGSKFCAFCGTKVITVVPAAEVAAVPEATAEPEVSAAPEVIAEPSAAQEMIAEPEVTAAPEVIAEPEVTAAPEVIAEPEVIKEQAPAPADQTQAQFAEMQKQLQAMQQQLAAVTQEKEEAKKQAELEKQKQAAELARQKQEADAKRVEYERRQAEETLNRQAEAAKTMVPKKKKSKAPAVIITLLVIILLGVGGLFVYCSFFDYNKDIEVFQYFDLTKEEESVLSEKEESAFLKLIKKWDKACAEQDTGALADAFPFYAIEYILEQNHTTDVNSLLSSMYQNGIEQLGDSVDITEEVIDAKKLNADALYEDFLKEYDSEVKVEKAYLVKCTSTFEGSKDKKSYTDQFLFYKADGTWYMILTYEPDKFK